MHINHDHINHKSVFLTAIERSRARRRQAETQLRALRGTAQRAPLAELDGLLVHELRLEARLEEVLSRDSGHRSSPEEFRADAC
jgi:hypothetical protein